MVFYGLLGQRGGLAGLPGFGVGRHAGRKLLLLAYAQRRVACTQLLDEGRVDFTSTLWTLTRSGWL
jgi:hypothetical protein